MAKRIVWSSKARKGFKDILNYWSVRNQSKSYPQKLSSKINFKLGLLTEFPHLGLSTTNSNSRVTHLDNYLIFYEIDNNTILIQAIVDGRRDLE